MVAGSTAYMADMGNGTNAMFCSNPAKPQPKKQAALFSITQMSFKK
jgi:hypothetical protein